MTRSEGTIGKLTDAAVAAIESGEEAGNQRTLLMAQYGGPTRALVGYNLDPAEAVDNARRHAGPDADL